MFTPGQDIPSGRKSVFVCGDLCPLPPVPGKPVFAFNETETGRICKYGFMDKVQIIRTWSSNAVR